MRNRKRIYWVIGLAILVASLAVLVLLRDPPEALYNNHSASYWTAQLSNNDPAIRTEAVTALKSMGPGALPDLDRSVRHRHWYFENPLGSATHFLPRGFINRMNHLLRRDELKTRRLNAIRGLEMLGPKAAPAIPALESALMDVDITISTTAAIALARIGSEAVPALAQGLKSRSPAVRANACYGLGLLGPLAKGAIPDLWKVCETEMGMLGYQASECLGNMRELAAPFLTERLDETDSRLRGLAAHALAMMGPFGTEAIPALVRHAEDRDNMTRQRVIHALTTILPSNPAAAEALLRALNDPQVAIRVEAVQGLLEAPRAVRGAKSQLVHALADADPAVRGGAARVLGQLGSYGTEVVPDLTKLLTDPNEEVRRNAKVALETIKVPNR